MTDYDEIRDKDHLVLRQIAQGNDDVQKITAETTLENHHVSYAFEKLERLGLLHVSKPEGTVERVIDGQKRVFQHPQQAALTDKGEHYLAQADQREFDEYEDLSHRELVQRVQHLEDRVETIEQFETFREQVQRNLD